MDYATFSLLSLFFVQHSVGGGSDLWRLMATPWKLTPEVQFDENYKTVFIWFQWKEIYIYSLKTNLDMVSCFTTDRLIFRAAYLCPPPIPVASEWLKRLKGLPFTSQKWNNWEDTYNILGFWNSPPGMFNLGPHLTYPLELQLEWDASGWCCRHMCGNFHSHWQLGTSVLVCTHLRFACDLKFV